ncbi:hypothetical protein D7Y09_16105 [bacterium 1XD42-1]|nr:hypothetical protein D7X25_28220 [bacterium 1XD42-8]RKJ61270.1 hypothetical protein D7Y09_16105 [bacterium 1XD42-1]
MPKTRLLTPEARMNEQLLATIDKYKRIARITRYGDLGPRIGKCAATANNRIKSPGTFTLDELRKLVRSLHIPPEDLLPAIYEGKGRV